jgi:ABC-type polar amino acid transport system ATPase subunit
MTEQIVEFECVDKWFGDFHALKSINLKVASGSGVVICGPSGSGKSTLLRCINGLERIQSGTVRVMGREINNETLTSAGFRASIGMVFQRFSLYPHMSVMNNLTLAPRKVLCLTTKEAETRGRKMLDRVGLLDKADAVPSELSGGQAQRVAIARALVMEPKIMLFDEPTSALDPEMIHEVLDVMRDLRHGGMTMLTVTHEMGFAKEASDEVFFIDEGKIVEVCQAETFFSTPRTERAKKFLKQILYH